MSVKAGSCNSYILLGMPWNVEHMRWQGTAQKMSKESFSWVQTCDGRIRCPAALSLSGHHTPRMLIRCGMRRPQTLDSRSLCTCMLMARLSFASFHLEVFPNKCVLELQGYITGNMLSPATKRGAVCMAPSPRADISALSNFWFYRWWKCFCA